MRLLKKTLKNPRLWLGIIILSIFLYKINIDATALYTADKTLLAAAILALIIQTIIRAYRWSYITHIFTKKNTFIHSAKIYYIGQLLNEIAPQGTGDITKAYLSYKSYKTKTKSILIPITERISDISALALGSILILYTLPLNLSKYHLNIAIAIAVLTIIYTTLLKPKYLEKILNTALRILTKGKKNIKKGELHWRDLNKKNILTIAIITASCWLLEAIAHKQIIQSLGYTITYPQILAIVCFSWLASIPAFLPGGIGVREIIYAYLLTLTGIPLATGSLIAVTYRAIIWLKFGTLGFLSYITYKNINLHEINTTHQKTTKTN